MAWSVTEIANIALTNVGEPTVLDVDTDNQPGARAFRANYPVARDAVLGAANWGFARRWAQPGAPSAAVTPPLGWSFAFAYPPDCLTFRGVFAAPYSPSPLPAELVNLPNADGYDTLMILANAPAPWIVYTRRVDNPALFSSLFVETLAWKVGIALSMARARSAEMQARCEQMYERRLLEAQAQAVREQPRPRLADSEMILARGGGCEPLLPGDPWSTWIGYRDGNTVPSA